MNISRLMDVAAIGAWWFLLPCLVDGLGNGGKDHRWQQQQRHDRLHNSRRFLQVNDTVEAVAVGADPVPSETLRKDLLQNYDAGAFPWERIWAESTTADGIVKGLNVEMGLNFHKIIEVDVTRSIVDYIVWVRFQWKDPRLVWDPAEYGNITETFFYLNPDEGINEIWTPDITLWNLESGLNEYLVSPTAAKVSSDGTIFWSRPGRIRPVCKFKGLEDFPFDQLSCTIEFGSWAYSGKYIRLTRLGGTGFSLGGSDTSGEAYAEYSLTNVTAEEKLYPPYPSSPSEDWPVLWYHMQFERAVRPYQRGYIFINILLNLVGFCALWLPVQCGERMGLAITAVLTSVALELVVSQSLPMSNAVTWIQTFSLGQTLFAFAVVFECSVVMYLFYYTGDTLEPSWWKWLRRKVRKHEGEERASDTSGTNEPARQLNTIEDSAITNADADLVGADGVTRDVNVRQHHTDANVRFLDDSEHSEESLNDIPDATDNRKAKMRFNRMSMSMGAKGFKDPREASNNRQWQKCSAKVDEVSRLVFPSAFVIFLAVMFATTRDGTSL